MITWMIRKEIIVMNKGPFLYWSNDTGSNARIRMLREHYALLSATYLQRGMEKEAEAFVKVTEDFGLFLHSSLQVCSGQECVKRPKSSVTFTNASASTRVFRNRAHKAIITINPWLHYSK